MEFHEAALRVLREDGGPLHWTVIQDHALTRGYLDPFTQPDIREHLLAALGDAVREGAAVRTGRGLYALAPEGD
jgi:hypothetical protein